MRYLKWKIFAIAVTAAVLVFGEGRLSTAQQAAQPPAATEVPEQFPDHPGRDETFVFCTGCHSFKIVAAQGMTREKWNETLVWMTEKQNMADIQGEPRELILDYLAAAFPPKRQGGWKQPFAN